MIMPLTEQQEALLQRRKSPELSIREFLEVTLLQVEVRMYQAEKFDYQPKIDALRARIEPVDGNSLMQEIGNIVSECNALVLEIMRT